MHALVPWGPSWTWHEEPSLPFPRPCAKGYVSTQHGNVMTTTTTTTTTMTKARKGGVLYGTHSPNTGGKHECLKLKLKRVHCASPLSSYLQVMMTRMARKGKKTDKELTLGFVAFASFGIWVDRRQERELWCYYRQGQRERKGTRTKKGQSEDSDQGGRSDASLVDASSYRQGPNKQRLRAHYR